MDNIIGFVSAKGGLGKSTFVAKAGRLMAFQNKKILLLELCPGLRNLDLILKIEQPIFYDCSDIGKKCSMEKAILPIMENLFYLPAPQNKTFQDLSEKEISDLIQKTSKDFDYVFIDCMTGIDPFLTNIIKECSHLIYFTSKEVTSLRNTEKLYHILSKAHRPKYAGLFLTKLSLKKNEEDMRKELVNTMEERFSLPIWGMFDEHTFDEQYFCQCISRVLELELSIPNKKNSGLFQHFSTWFGGKK